MRLLICGGRYWADAQAIYVAMSELDSLHSDLVLIHGAASGADAFSAMYAHTLEWEIECYPAEWSRYGKRAGPLRNKQMLQAASVPVIIFSPTQE